MSNLQERLMEAWSAYELKKASKHGYEEPPEDTAEAYITFLETKIKMAEAIIGCEFSQWYGKISENNGTEDEK